MTDALPPRPLLSPPEDAEVIDVGGVRHVFRLSGAQTGGRLSFEEFTLAPGQLGARPHVHEAHDEYFYVLSGELAMHDGRGETILRPGGLLAATRGTAHGFRNAGTTEARALCLYTPSGYEGYFRELHQALESGATLTDDLMAEVRSRYHSWTL